MRVAENVPAAVGLKVNVMTQELPAASVAFPPHEVAPLNR